MDKLADTFWNIRGVHRLGGLIDIGTQMSVVDRGDGSFVLIDGCALSESQRKSLLKLTDGGERVAAIIMVHPFHTLHAEATHRLFPGATLYGTARHREQAPELPWASKPVENWRTKHPLSDMFDLSVPDGVDFVSSDERVHFGSVLVRHRQTHIVHVDDTFMVLAPPRFLRGVIPQSSLLMHPMLSRALKKTAGAADAFSAWATQLGERWSDTRIVCAAHSAVRKLPKGGFPREVESALKKVSGTLERHRARYN